MRYTVRRETSGFEAASLIVGSIFLGSLLAIGLFILIPFLVAIEVKALLARHRIRKEREMSQ